MDRQSGEEGEGTPASGGHSLFGNPDFALFLATRVGVMFGAQAISVSVGWHVYALRGNVLDLGLIGLAQFLPVLLLFLAAGLVADRVDRRVIMMATCIVECLVAVAIGLYFLSGSDSLSIVLGLLAVHGAARCFYFPASQALLPLVVSREQLPGAIAAASSVTKFGQLGGPALAGLLIAFLDEGVYWVAAALYATFAVAVRLIRLRHRPPSTRRPGLDGILHGFAFIRRRRTLLGVISLDVVAVLCGSVVGLLPVFAIDILQVGPEALGLMRAMPALGGLVVALVLSRVSAPPHFGRMLFAGLAVFGLSTLVFSYSTALWLSLLALAVHGAADMASVYVRQILIQLETPDELRGRVNAVNSVSINASNELGDLRAGVTAAAVGAVPAVVLGGLASLGVTALWWHLFPELRAVRAATLYAGSTA